MVFTNRLLHQKNVGLQTQADVPDFPAVFNLNPKYNPLDWPIKINILTTSAGPQAQFSNAGTFCQEFPDEKDNTVDIWWEPKYNDVFCWQNGTYENAAGTIFVRTTGTTNGPCYINTKHILEVDNMPKDYTKLLPYCGPYRPYGIFLLRDGWVDYQTNASPSRGTLPRVNDYASIPCYNKPSLNATRGFVEWESPHFYCWVNGQSVGNNTRWYLNAHLLDGESRKCYLPLDMVEPRAALKVMDGAGGECPKEDWPPASS
ncbi:hypothetical protein G7Y89_g10572 [Cudoniella acicularis]|uniref:Uncharacterized protein n=1 Tax=Cudoniella acicularis TaxID=354080 RepID=A0A8H4RF98_9HELO|nr:hypothetical protein G7Y89_g10572 [Cudoniella acicularis]